MNEIDRIKELEKEMDLLVQFNQSTTNLLKDMQDNMILIAQRLFKVEKEYAKPQ